MRARRFHRFLPGLLLALLAPASACAQIPDPAHVQLTFSGNVQDGAVSPDGRFLAYVESSVTGDDRLLVRALEGGEPRELVRALHVFHLRWSPSSESLLVGVQPDTVSGDVRILPRDGGPGRTFDATRWFAWSPDETAFAFADYRPHALYLRDLASGGVDTLPLPEGYHTLLDLDWSREGDRFAYVVLREPSTYEVRVIDRSGGGARSIAVDSVPLYSPRWSRDDRAILYSRIRDGAKEVVRVELAPGGGTGGAPDVVAHLGQAISFDLVEQDTAISYIGIRGPTDLVLLDLETGQSRALVSAPTLFADPAPSPDGREAAFLRWTEGTMSLEVSTLATGATRTLVSTTEVICCPAWSPDGGDVAYASWTGTPASGGSRRVGEPP